MTINPLVSFNWLIDCQKLKKLHAELYLYFKAGIYTFRINMRLTFIGKGNLPRETWESLRQFPEMISTSGFKLDLKDDSRIPLGLLSVP